MLGLWCFFNAASHMLLKKVHFFAGLRWKGEIGTSRVEVSTGRANRALLLCVAPLKVISGKILSCLN